MEYTDRVLDSSLSSHALDSLDNDFLSLLVSIQLSIINNFIDIAGSIKTSLILQTLHETILSFLSAQSGKFFQLSLLLLLHLLKFLLLDCEKFLFIINTLLILINLLLATTEILLTLVERDFALLKFILTLLNTGIALLHFLLQLSFLIEELLFHFEKFFLL